RTERHPLGRLGDVGLLAVKGGYETGHIDQHGRRRRLAGLRINRHRVYIIVGGQAGPRLEGCNEVSGAVAFRRCRAGEPMRCSWQKNSEACGWLSASWRARLGYGV